MKEYHSPQKSYTKKRLSIEGHAKAINRMVNEEGRYSGIVQQISAVRFALDRVTEIIVQDLLEYCISQTTYIKGKETAREIKYTVSRIL